MRRQEPFIWFWIDLGAFLVSRARNLAARAASRFGRRRRVQRLLRQMPEVAGTVAVIRSIIAPLSGLSVAACRLIVERASQDGSWMPIFDETQLGELDVCHQAARARLDGPAVLVKPEGTEFDGGAVKRALGQAMPAEEEDLRATEFLLFHGEAVHVFGVELANLRDSSVDPYRAPPPALLRKAAGSAVVISTWTRDQFFRETRRQPILLPPC